MIVEKDGLFYELGRIRKAEIEFVKGTIFVMSMDFDFGGSGQGLSIVLDTCAEVNGEKQRNPTAGGLDYIMQIMKVVGAEKFSDVSGSIVYAIREKEKKWGIGNPVVGVASPDFETGKTFLINEWRKYWGVPED